MSSLDQIYLDGAKCATNGIFKNLFLFYVYGKVQSIFMI